MYALIDNPNDREKWGLIRANRTKKAAFWGLRRLINTVYDTRGHNTGSLTYTVNKTGGNWPLREMLLQKSDKTYLLFLWRPLQHWDFDDKREGYFRWEFARVNVNGNVQSIREIVPSEDTNKGIGNNTNIGFGDRLVILEIKMR